MSAEVGLPEALERAASALEEDADAIRPANGDPVQLLESLEAGAAARVLTWLLDNEPAAGNELALSWAEDPDRGLPTVLGIDLDSLPKGARKALRRVLHQLRSRGVEVEAPRRKDVVASLPPVEEALNEGLVTPLDPSGARLVYLAVNHPSGGVRLFMLALDEERGLLEFELYTAGRRDARRFLRDFRERERFAAVEAPAASVRALIARAAQEQPADRPLPRSFVQWRSRLTADPGATPGEAVREALEPDDSRPALQQIAEQVSKGELGPWVPRPEALNDAVAKLRDVESGVLIVSGATRREQVGRVLEETLSKAYAPPSDERAARRFEETAFVHWKSGREEDARACLGVAQAFRKSPPPDNPVARAALERMLGPALERFSKEGEAPEPGSLVVKP